MEPLIVRVEDTETRTAAEHAFVRSPVRIGRSTHNDLCLVQRFVSAWHGVLDFNPDGVRYTDLGSTNGTLLNGAPIEAHATVVLERDAEVTIGSLRFTFSLHRSGDLPAVVPAVTEPGTAAPIHGRATVYPAPEPPPAPGGITALMKKLASAPSEDLERAWRRILVPGATIGRFELVREIGRGSFGIVFEARDRQLGRLVAFKAVKPGRESQVMLRQELLQKEAEAAAQLNHPNIVSLHDVGTCESGPYLIMELLKGESLRERMLRGRIPIAEALEIATEIAWALDHAHGAGVIHRDIKPANVFLCANGQVKVLDFGIAHVLGGGSRSAAGTPAYMAPEQWRETRQDERTDIFGAAATLAEMVTGKLPYRVTEKGSAVLDPGARPFLDAPGVPSQLIGLLRRGLSANPEVRPKDGHAWLTALLEIHEILDRTQKVDLEHRQGARAGSRAKVGPHRRAHSRIELRRALAYSAAAVAAAVVVVALAYYLLLR